MKIWFVCFSTPARFTLLHTAFVCRAFLIFKIKVIYHLVWMLLGVVGIFSLTLRLFFVSAALPPFLPRYAPLLFASIPRPLSQMRVEKMVKNEKHLMEILFTHFIYVTICVHILANGFYICVEGLIASVSSFNANSFGRIGREVNGNWVREVRSLK